MDNMTKLTSLAASTEIAHGRRTQRLLGPYTVGDVLAVAVQAVITGHAFASRIAGKLPKCHRYPAEADAQAIGAVRHGGRVVIGAVGTTIRANGATACRSQRRILGRAWVSDSSTPAERLAELLALPPERRTAISRRWLLARLPKG